jgi:hypothetical protein
MRRTRREERLRQWIAAVGSILLFGCILGMANSSGAQPEKEIVLMLGANVGMVLVIVWRVMLKTARYRA